MSDRGKRKRRVRTTKPARSFNTAKRGVVGTPGADAQGRNVRETQAAGFRPGYNECPGCGGPKQFQSGMCSKCRGTGHLTGEAARAVRDRRVVMCGRPTKSGNPCRNVAGLKTTHSGVGPCFMHGGTLPNVEKKAFEQKAEMEFRAELARQDEESGGDGSAVAARGPVTPEEAIQWLLDTGLMRAKRWEDALQQWNTMKPVERNAAVTLSMAERSSLRETAGLARRTGYHPTEQLRQFSELVMSALDEGLSRSGLEEMKHEHPWLEAALDGLTNGMIDVMNRAEQEARRSAAGASRNGDDGVIDGVAHEPSNGGGARIGPYERWLTQDLRDELSERGLARGGRREVLIAKLRHDDQRPEDR